MDTGSYTSCGEEVALGVECALPYRAASQVQDEGETPSPPPSGGTAEAASRRSGPSEYD